MPEKLQKPRIFRKRGVDTMMLFYFIVALVISDSLIALVIACMAHAGSREHNEEDDRAGEE